MDRPLTLSELCDAVGDLTTALIDHRPISDHLGQMGLWDMDANLNRIPTPLVDAYRALVSGGSNAAGRLNLRQVLEERESDVPQLLSSGL